MWDSTCHEAGDFEHRMVKLVANRAVNFYLKKKKNYSSNVWGKMQAFNLMFEFKIHSV